MLLRRQRGAVRRGKSEAAFTILVAAIAYQYDLDPGRYDGDRFHFVVVDEMFSKVDDQYSEYALQLFEKFGLQLLIVAPLDAKARVTGPIASLIAAPAVGLARAVGYDKGMSDDDQPGIPIVARPDLQ